jgi:hypothetical protein
MRIRIHGPDSVRSPLDPGQSLPPNKHKVEFLQKSLLHKGIGKRLENRSKYDVTVQKYFYKVEVYLFTIRQFIATESESGSTFSFAARSGTRRAKKSMRIRGPETLIKISTKVHLNRQRRFLRFM